MREFSTMKEIGGRFGVTSHQIGRLLKELGLRTHDGRPSEKAFEFGLVEKRWTNSMEHYLWAWRAEEIVLILIDAGLKERCDDVAVPPDAR